MIMFFTLLFRKFKLTSVLTETLLLSITRNCDLMNLDELKEGSFVSKS